MGNSAEIIGNIATSIFLILIVATVFTQYYVIKVDLGPLGTYPQYPYKEYFFSLAISSAISLAIGIAAHMQRKISSNPNQEFWVPNLNPQTEC